jgi:ABC-type Fe3+-hydroxamate transport system substrate-binding protein
MWLLTGIFQSTLAAAKLETLELTLDWVKTSVSEQPKPRYFCPIWAEVFQGNLPWWMTFNQDTYCHDLLSLIGGENIFSERQRLYPLEADLRLAQPKSSEDRDVRYPRVTPQEIIAGQPEIILIPSEPMEFGQKDIDLLRTFLADTPAVKNNRISFVDGSLITWHGTRIAHALRELPALFHSFDI